MDPKANIKEQRELARWLEAHDSATVGYLAKAERLAELVVALAEWEAKGGFKPAEERKPDPLLMVVDIRLGTLALAIRERDWEQTMREWDRTRSALDKLLAGGAPRDPRTGERA